MYGKKRTLFCAAILLLCLCLPSALAVTGDIQDTDDLLNSELEGLGKIWFLIDASAGEGGSINPAGSNLVVRNKSRAYQIIPETGYQIADVKVDGVSVGAVKEYEFTKITDHHTISASFTKIGGQTETPLPVQYRQYQDLDPAAWYANYVGFVLARGLMDPMSQTAFSPNAPVTRGMMILALHRMSGEETAATPAGFQDVLPSSPYYNAVNWGVAKGIVSGYSETSFGPDDAVTREQMAVMFWQYAGKPQLNLTNPAVVLERFDDREQISNWAGDAMRWAVNHTLFSGNDAGQLVPQETATRAQAAVLLEKVSKLTV